MKHYLYILFLLFLLLPPIHAQKVGLVLSGGGAKGLTHIGIIRALEENGPTFAILTASNGVRKLSWSGE